MNDATTSEEKKRVRAGLLQFAKDVIPFSTEFDDFIKKMFPDDKPLLETLPTHEFTAGRLGITYYRLTGELTRELADPEKIIAILESNEHDELLEKARLAQVAGILSFRCHDAESETPIV